MVKFIKAYNNRDDTVFELRVIGVNPNTAKLKGAVALFGRRPGQITGLKNIEVEEFSDGVVREYRVMITVETNSSLKDKLKLNNAVEALENLL